MYKQLFQTSAILLGLGVALGSSVQAGRNLPPEEEGVVATYRLPTPEEVTSAVARINVATRPGPMGPTGGDIQTLPSQNIRGWEVSYSRATTDDRTLVPPHPHCTMNGTSVSFDKIQDVPKRTIARVTYGCDAGWHVSSLRDLPGWGWSWTSQGGLQQHQH